MTWGSNVRAKRKAARLSLRDVAGVAGIDYTYLCRIERGSVPPPSTAAIRGIAQAIGADADELIAACGKTDAHYSARLRQRISDLEACLHRFVDHESDPCRFDHHGYCQEHGLFENPCPVAEGRRLLGRVAEAGAAGR